jgi:hypothetical protein
MMIRRKINSVDIVAAVLVAFMEQRGSNWSGTEKQLYDELTKFKNDKVNITAITKAILKLKEAQKE